jgi:hypothetical protein
MNQKKTIEDLREVLFATIAGVRDGSMSIEQAQTISGLSQVMVNSAKVEVDYSKATGQKGGSGFLDQPSQLPAGITGITQHRIR